jgi:hypothetical protein
MRDRFVAHLAEHQIGAVFHDRPLHLSKFGCQLGQLSVITQIMNMPGNVLFDFHCLLH